VAKELDVRLHEKLNGTDSAVVLVLQGGQTVLEWSHGRVRSNVSEKEDARKVDANTIWRIASITKVVSL
jgi:CubicO group peptidase (beta-lactamase class C family)